MDRTGFEEADRDQFFTSFSSGGNGKPESLSLFFISLLSIIFPTFRPFHPTEWWSLHFSSSSFTSSHPSTTQPEHINIWNMCTRKESHPSESFLFIPAQAFWYFFFSQHWRNIEEFGQVLMVSFNIAFSLFPFSILSRSSLLLLLLQHWLFYQ